MWRLVLVALACVVPVEAAVRVNGGADVARVRVPERVQHWRPDGVWMAPVVGADMPDVPLPPRVQTLETKVRVDGFEVEGLYAVSATVVGEMLKPLVGREVTAADLLAVQEAVRVLYVRAGYPAVRVQLAPQTLKTAGSVVRLRVDEQAKPVVRVAGGAAHAGVVLAAAEAVRAAPLPLATADIERAVAPLNAVPGMQAMAKLDWQGEAPLVTLRAERPRWEAMLGMNNYGSRFLGPNQWEGALRARGVMDAVAGLWGAQVALMDEVQLDVIQSSDLEGVSYARLGYRVPVGPWGTVLDGSYAMGATNPGWTLEPLDLEGRTRQWRVGVIQPLVDDGVWDWAMRAHLDHVRARNSVTSAALSEDVGTTLRMGTDVAWQRPGTRLRGAVGVDQGVDAMGSLPAGTLTSSRWRGTNTAFTKVVADVEWLQNLNDSWRVLLAGRGQLSSHALLAGEEIGFGGAGWGRGYSNQELLGDHGVLGKAELQLLWRVGEPWLEAYQLFGFYDFGALWNKDRDPGEPAGAATRLSGGFGARLALTSTLEAELVFAKPLSHSALTQGDGDASVLFGVRKTFESVN